MAESKTVSNLPIDVSIRWAEDQKLLQESELIIRDSTRASSQVQTDAIFPAKLSEVEALLGLAKLHPSWATFQAPTGFFLQRRKIFKSQLVPFLGSDEQQDSLITRVQSVKGDDQDGEWEDERNRLVALLQLLQSLNKDLIDIFTRCKQYQKG